MPYLNIKFTAPASDEITQQVAKSLTELTAEILKKKPALTAIVVERVPATDWFVGAQSLTAQGLAGFYLDIKVTDGTNTKDEKARYVACVFDAMEQLIGALHPTSYVVIHDVRADAWGYQGRTQEYRYIQGKPL